MPGRAHPKAAQPPRGGAQRAAPRTTQPRKTKQRRVAPTPVDGNAPEGAVADAVDGLIALEERGGNASERSKPRKTKQRRVAPTAAAPRRKKQRRAETATELVDRYEATVDTIDAGLDNQRETVEKAYRIDPYRLDPSALRTELRELRRTLDDARKQCNTLLLGADELVSIDAMVAEQEAADYEQIRPVEITSGPHKGKWRCSEASGPGHVCTGGRKHSGRQGFHPASKHSKVEYHIRAVHAPDQGARRYRRETKTQLPGWVV